MENNIYDTVKEVYKKSTYLDHYGGSVFITFITVIVFFLLFSYFYIMSNAKALRKDWPSQRCNPSVIPFAGFVMDDPKLSKFEFTGQNFNSCLNNILTQISNDALQPLNFATSVVGGAVGGVSGVLNSIRERIAKMVENMENTIGNIFGRILNFLTPIRFMLIKMRDSLYKMNAIVLTALYSAVGTFLGIKSFIGNFITIAIIVLIALAVIIAVLLMFFFTAPLAVPPLLIFTALSAVVIYIIAALGEIMELTKPDMPEKPRCFDGSTIVELNGGVKCRMRDLKPGQYMSDGSKITATMKLSTHGITMYDYNGIVVSGNHNVMVDDGVWKAVKDLDESIEIPDYDDEFIYCINTTSKRIKIDRRYFSDWDDLDDIEIFNIRTKFIDIMPSYFNRDQFHKYLDGGFAGSTLIEMEDGNVKMLQDIDVNDELRFNGRVLGVVKINMNDLKLTKYIIDDKVFYGGPNNVICDNEIVSYEKESIGPDLESPNSYLYHLITEDGRLVIDGVKFYDYDGCMEFYLNDE